VAEAPSEAAREQLGRTARAAGFRILRTIVEAEGVCPNCAAEDA
jgi:Fur family zinc uptake transcriptional regulator